MPSIESLGYPLAYKVNSEVYSAPSLKTDEGEIAVRLEARALEGMQKEALVQYGPNNAVWRMVSDEGPYLNGTDLAPFPLAFYAAGMAFSFLSELERHAKQQNVEMRSVSIEQDNFYTMEGSAIRGDMIGGALPSEIIVHIDADTSPDNIAAIIKQAEASSPAQAYMNDVLQNTFSLEANGEPLPVSGVAESPGERIADPEPDFQTAEPAGSEEFLDDIITKRATAEAVKGAEGGAGSSLKSEQKRTLHVHAEAAIRKDGLREAEIRLFKPIGSTFHFISDEASLVAPPSLGYLSAGVAFCYMTQLGRYATIVKQDLTAYRIVQENVFKIGGELEKAAAKPVDTQLFVTLNDTDEGAQRLLRMGERTCFLHAAMRSSNRTELSAELGGEHIDLN